MNEWEVFNGKDCVLYFSQIILICFISVFVSLAFSSSNNLFLFGFSLRLKVSYSVSNFIIFIKT